MSFDPRFTVTSVKHSQKIAVWGCLSSAGPGELHLIEGRDKYFYQNLKIFLHGKDIYPIWKAQIIQNKITQKNHMFCKQWISKNRNIYPWLGNMEKHQYRYILKKHMKSSVRKLGMSRRFVFQQDNDPKVLFKL